MLLDIAIIVFLMVAAILLILAEICLLYTSDAADE